MRKEGQGQKGDDQEGSIECTSIVRQLVDLMEQETKIALLGVRLHLSLKNIQLSVGWRIRRKSNVVRHGECGCIRAPEQRAETKYNPCEQISDWILFRNQRKQSMGRVTVQRRKTK